ncbi:hypothetical protein ATPR_2156 [Acetobacter tropicalis NBRC 101654]|uniref:Uncharacterized protein n=1 Tax=Acetobacter tropicalis NBRC 101654 TaxID=749388 RepID=F7VFK7_9PROT|nr:hypothetical protein ATPR_2156 [Acetobacter tropicalis NBRC 101654]
MRAEEHTHERRNPSESDLSVHRTAGNGAASTTFMVWFGIAWDFMGSKLKQQKKQQKTAVCKVLS